MNKINKILEFLDKKELKLLCPLNMITDNPPNTKDRDVEKYYNYETRQVIVETFVWDHHSRIERYKQKFHFPLNGKVIKNIKANILPLLEIEMRKKVQEQILNELVDNKIKELGLE